MLKEYGMFVDKINVKSTLEYLNNYIVTDKGSVFLLHRSFAFDKDVNEGVAKFTDKDVGLCPIYQFIIKDEEGNVIGNNEYSIFLLRKMILK